PDDLPLERLRLELSGVRQDAVPHLFGEIQPFGDLERLLVVPEAAAEPLLQRAVERVLACMAERRMAGIVAEPDRLDQVLVQPQCPGDDPRDRRRLARVRHARPEVMAARTVENLRLPFQAPN